MYNSESCVDCPLGYYASTAQEDACFSCDEGFYTGESSKATNCIACDGGRFSEGLSMDCTDCPSGYSSSARASECTVCDAGKYSDEAASSSCSFCNTGGNSEGFSSDEGASWCNRCEKGYYRKDNGGKTTSQLTEGGGDLCTECTGGMNCDDAEGVTLESLPVKEGFYRFAIDSEKVYDCARWKYGKNCAGGSPAANSTTAAPTPAPTTIAPTPAPTAGPGSRFRQRRLASDGSDDTDDTTTGVTYGEATCITSATGPLCAVCVEGAYFDPDDEQCTDCEGYKLATYQVLMILLFVTILAIFTAYKCCTAERWAEFETFARLSTGAGEADLDTIQSTYAKHASSPTSERRKERNARLLKKARKLMPKLKIMFTFSQLVAGFDFILNVRFPEPFASVMNALDSLNLSFFKMAPPSCYIYGANFMTDLVFTTLYPIAISMALLALHGRQKDEESSTYFSLFLLLTYLVLPSTALKIFSSFKTDEFDAGGDGERSFLAVDYSIDAHTAEYDALWFYAGCMTLIYVIGTPLLYAVLLFRNQRELSIHAPFSLEPKKLCASADKRAELKATLVEFLAGDATLGKGVTEKTFGMLDDVAQTDDFMRWLDETGKTRPSTSGYLPLLKGYFAAEQRKWEDVSHDHVLSFLLGSYEKRVYWFEFVEVLRRLLLSGVLVLFGPGSVVQSAASILICSASIKAYSLYQPFRSDDDDFLQEVAQVQLFLVLLAAILMRVDASDDSDDDQTYLGWLLVAVLVPGYALMVYLCVKEWRAQADRYEEVAASALEMANFGQAETERPAEATTTATAAPPPTPGAANPSVAGKAGALFDRSFGGNGGKAKEENATGGDELDLFFRDDGRGGSQVMVEATL